MKRKIAVEPDLTPVKDLLQQKGYEVESINFGSMTMDNTDKYDAFVVTGMDENFLGVNDTGTKAIVIDASGLSADQIYNELESRLK